MNPTGLNRHIDIVFCIDGSASMAPIMDNVKSTANRLFGEIMEYYAEHNLEVSVRQRYIVFRDYASEGDKAIEESPFFDLPTDEDAMVACLQGISGRGGGEKNNGIEALHRAIVSDFKKEPMDRQIIVLISSNEALPLGMRRFRPGYPKDMPDAEKLQEEWMALPRKKFLICFAPEGTRYHLLAQSLGSYAFGAIDPERGLEGIDVSDVVRILFAD